MANKSNWVDYSNLGATIVTAGLVYATNRKLNQMAQIQMAAAERTKLENDLRQLVFSLEEGIDRLTKYRENAPLGVATSIEVVEVLANEAGIQPATFEQFGDKDRIRGFRNRLTVLKEEIFSKLSLQEKDEVVNTIHLVPHLDDLRKLIVALEAKDQLQKTQREWEALSQAKSNANTQWYVLLAVGIIFIIIAGSIVSGQTTLALVILLPSIFMTGFSLYKIGKTPTPAYQDLYKNRFEWQSKLIPQNQYDKICQIFGTGLGIEEYKKTGEKVSDFMIKALEQDKDGGPLETNLLKVVLPPEFYEKKA